MKSLHLLGSLLAFGLTITSPKLSLAHVGHGDEFQAEGGINRVQVNPEMDPILGIQVAPIETVSEDGATVLIPITALVDADGKQLIFVEYDGFYEPVPVTTGATQGDLIEVTSGLSMGELLVTQGSLSLYAESRKTQTAAAEPAVTPAPTTAAEKPVETAESVAVAPDTATEASTATTAETAPEATAEATLSQASVNPEIEAKSGKFPMTAAIGGGAVALIVVGTVLVIASGPKGNS